MHENFDEPIKRRIDDQKNQSLFLYYNQIYSFPVENAGKKPTLAKKKKKKEERERKVAYQEARHTFSA